MENINLSKLATYHAGAVQASVNRSLQKICDDTLAPFGLTKMHWLIVGHVLDAGKDGIQISELSKALGTTMPYLTNAINNLESKGYLQRKEDNDDKRTKYVVVTPKQVLKCYKIEEYLRAALRDTIYKKVSQEDFRTYIKVLYQMEQLGE